MCRAIERRVTVVSRWSSSCFHCCRRLLHDYAGDVFLAQTTVAFDIVFGIFLVAIVTLTVLTVRFIRRQDRQRRR